MNFFVKENDEEDDTSCNHPIYNAISYANGQINRMNLQQVIFVC